MTECVWELLLCMVLTLLCIFFTIGTPMIPVHVGIVSPTPAVSSTWMNESQFFFIIEWSLTVCCEKLCTVLNWSVLVHKASNNLNDIAIGSGPDHHLSATKVCDSKERTRQHQSQGWWRQRRSNYHRVRWKHLGKGGRHVDPATPSGEFVPPANAPPFLFCPGCFSFFYLLDHFFCTQV